MTREKKKKISAYGQLDNNYINHPCKYSRARVASQRGRPSTARGVLVACPFSLSTYKGVAVNYQGGSRVSRPSPCLHIARLVSNSTGNT
ncbi:unnamed protein product [Fusarium graminearum]|uniref:Chromosome 1, complete genome n=1 Tax=Gibberella zeae (strain ATCC MYA-4620 / CBS 123657 / FGSC 9075 / NRRL 31084 / PH-1) TaxID=229533 RepID=A0A098D9S9_GIBZE|nr:unnamed protein product [Fusarium graminearum]